MGWRLSITRTAPFHELGIKKCLIKTKNALLFIDPFRVIIPTTFIKLIVPTTVIFAPRKNSFNSEILLPHIERAWVRATPNKTPISSKKRGCPGQ
jgi:hypothetical protein